MSDQGTGGNSGKKDFGGQENTYMWDNLRQTATMTTDPGTADDEGSRQSKSNSPNPGIGGEEEFPPLPNLGEPAEGGAGAKQNDEPLQQGSQNSQTYYGKESGEYTAAGMPIYRMRAQERQEAIEAKKAKKLREEQARQKRLEEEKTARQLAAEEKRMKAAEDLKRKSEQEQDSATAREEEEDVDGGTRATKRRGIGSPMKDFRGNAGDSEKTPSTQLPPPPLPPSPPSSPIEVETVNSADQEENRFSSGDLSLDLSGNPKPKAATKKPGSSILRNRSKQASSTASRASHSTTETNSSGSRLKSTKSTSELFKGKQQTTLSQKGGRLSWGKKTIKEIPARTTQGEGRGDEAGGNMSHSTGGEGDAGKRTKRNLEGASKAAATKVPAYEFTAFVLITALIGPGVDASDVPDEWQATLGRALDKFHQMDSSVCILPPLDVPAGKRIYYKSDMPNLWTGWEDYMVHENHNLFNIPTPKDRPRKILSSCMIGFKDEPEKFLARSRTDINRADTGAHSIIFEHKSFQAWHSDRRIMLLNSPTKVPMSSVKDKCHTILSKLEKDLVTKYPEEYRPWQHSGPFPEFDVILDWGREGNWKDPKKRVAGEDTSHRKVPTFVYEKLNEERLIKICTAAKERELEKKAMGQHAFFQVLPEERGSKIDKAKKDQLDDWYITQGGTQKSLGDVILAGLAKPDVKVQVELEEDEAGPRASPGSYTVEEILMKIFGGTGSIFHAILRGHNGHFIDFFSGIDANVNKMAEEIGEALASWLKHYHLW